MRWIGRVGCAAALLSAACHVFLPVAQVAPGDSGGGATKDVSIAPDSVLDRAEGALADGAVDGRGDAQGGRSESVTYRLVSLSEENGGVVGPPIGRVLPEKWDLTRCGAARVETGGCDLLVEAVVMLAEVRAAQDDLAGSFTEIGIRASDDPGSYFNPDNLGVWMDLEHYAAGYSGKGVAADWMGAQAAGGRGASGYDVHDCDRPSVGAPVGSLPDFGFWFYPGEAPAGHPQHPLARDSATYNTGGKYALRLCHRAITATSGTLCYTVNEVAPGFYTTASPATERPDIYPAGLSFAGDMTSMQVFFGLWHNLVGPQTVTFSDVTITGCRAQPE